MSENICIIEGIYYNRLLPLVYFRPTYDLRCGIFSMREKIIHVYPQADITLHCRGYLADYVKQKNPGFKVNELSGDSCLFINGRVIVDEDFSKQIPIKGPDRLYVHGETIVAARISGNKLNTMKSAMNDVFTISDFAGLLKEEVEARIIDYPWDIIKYNSEEIINDFKRLTENVEKKINIEKKDYFHLFSDENIFIDEGTEIKPGVVLDAEHGPIYIGKNVKILPNAAIEGPAYVGDDSIIKMSSTIYSNTSIGRVCKVGGEVEDSIIHSFSNKQHVGFLGHSYLGSWVNLGSGTNNSDLKNNYGSIKVYINGEPVDSGVQFVGLTMGDHSKTAINTLFNTGTVVGVSANVFGGGFPPRYIPSFSWGGSESLTTYDMERSIEVAERVMTRRSVKMSEVDERLFRKVFDLTAEERRKRGMPN